MQKLNKPFAWAGLPRFFLWHVWLAFGMIFSGSLAQAAPEDFYNAHGKRDPFAPLVTQTSRQTASGLISVESLEEVAIQGIVYDPEKGSMIIANGSVLKEGEEQGAVKVLKIEKDGALFSVNGVEGFKAQYSSENSKKDSK